MIGDLLYGHDANLHPRNGGDLYYSGDPSEELHVAGGHTYEPRSHVGLLPSGSVCILRTQHLISDHGLHRPVAVEKGQGQP